MESGIAEAATPDAAAGSKTIADLLPTAEREYGSKRAILYKDAAGDWVGQTYGEVAEVVRSLSLGLIDLGVAKGDKV